MKKKSSAKIILLSFIIPCAAFLGACAVCRIAPFGGRTLMAVDMADQYVEFFGYLKSVFTGENDLFYTMSKTIGGDMYSFAAYYLFSPLNVIFAFVKLEDLPVAITFLAALKISLCGLFVCLFFLYHSDKKRPAVSLIASTSYALMAYNILYCCNIMWLDGVYAFPAVLLGIERLIREKRSGVYIVALAFSLMANYYIGYMLCIASVIYYICSAGSSGNGRIKDTLGCFALSSLIAGAASAVVLIPVFLSFEGTKAASAETLSLFATFRPLGFISRLFCGRLTSTDLYRGMPAVFCGISASIFAILFFFNRNITVRRKIFSGISAAAIVVSMYVSIINTAWHGFAYPACFPFRYAFVFSLFWLVPAHDCAVEMQGAFRSRIGEKLCSSRLLGAALCAVQLVSVFLCACELKNYAPDDLEYYRDYVVRVRNSIDPIKSSDDSLYRMEKINGDFNYPMLFSYNGLSHYCSTEKAATKDYARKMGLTHWDYFTRYGRGTSAAANSLLGIKYIVSEFEMPEPYEETGRTGDFITYTNPLALPVLFCAPRSALDGVEDTVDLLEYQNRIWTALSGNGMISPIYTKLPIESIAYDNINVTDCGEYTSLEPSDRSNPATVEYTVTADRDGVVYFYGSAEDFSFCWISINGGEENPYFAHDTCWNVLNLGSYSKGDTIKVRIRVQAESLKLIEPYFYYEDLPQLASASKMLSDGTEEVKKISSSRYEWTGRAGGKTVIFSVPYEKGWKAYIDGAETEIRPALGFFCAVDVPEAESYVAGPQPEVTVEFRYVPAGFAAGAIVSLAALIGLLALLFMQKRCINRD